MFCAWKTQLFENKGWKKFRCPACAVCLEIKSPDYVADLGLDKHRGRIINIRHTCPIDVENVFMVQAEKQHGKQWAEKKGAEKLKGGWWQALVQTFQLKNIGNWAQNACKASGGG